MKLNTYILYVEFHQDNSRWNSIIQIWKSLFQIVFSLLQIRFTLVADTIFIPREEYLF